MVPGRHDLATHRPMNPYCAFGRSVVCRTMRLDKPHRTIWTRSLSIACALALGSACSTSLGDPSVKPMPEPDPYPALTESGPLSERIANYRIRATLQPDSHTLTATETLSWKNTSDIAVHTLPFHLYMNAFKNQSSVFMSESRGQHRRASASTENWGWIDVSSVTIGGRELIDTVRYPNEPDETVMHVPLAEPVLPGGTIDVEFAFQVQLPEVFARTGYKGRFHMMGQWFPKIGVLVGAPGQTRWHCEPFHLNSEFIADFGTYDVELTVPDTHVIAATGVLTRATDNGDGTRTLSYRAEDVHDFAWMADPYMDVMSAQAQTANGPVEVRVYYRPRQRAYAKRHLHAGVGSIEHFSELYRTYPWPIMNIIDPPPDAASGAGGMEYPTLVTTAGDHYMLRPGIRMGEFVTVHEVGHNWFQGILASNEIDEAWMDEGVNEYADWVVMNEIYGEGQNLVDWGGFRADNMALSAAAMRISELPAPIDTISYEFPTYGSYSSATYRKTGLALRSLEAAVGREPFRAAMRTYAQRYAFKHPSGEDLFSTLEQSLGREVREFLEPAFRDIGAARFEVRKVKCLKKHPPRGVFGRGDGKQTVTEDDAPESDVYACEVLLVNLGRIPVPVDVEVVFADGDTRRERWAQKPGQTWHKLHLEHTAAIERVTIDPERHILINETWSASNWKNTADPAASRRAAARIGFWTQTAMQVTGL